MDIGLATIFVLSAAMVFVALRYGIVGGGGGVTKRQEQPVLFWLGVAIVTFIMLGARAALISSIVTGQGQ